MRHSDHRFWEIDFLRGNAIILMLAFHLLYDLNYLGRYDTGIKDGFELFVGRGAAILFIFLVGVSLTLSYSRYIEQHPDQRGACWKYLKRGLYIFSWGLGVTTATWIFARDGLIVFGVLHFIGISIIIAYPFLKYRFWNLFLGTMILISGTYLKNINVDHNWLLWMGIHTNDLYTFDYFPILPWFGMTLIGIFVGNSLYPNHTRYFSIPDISAHPPIRVLCFMGRQSLLIYLLHQPVIIGLMYLMGLVDPGHITYGIY
ncbi:MAG: heparan-alpha-glucosaminide N-acetyltransferase [Methanosarcinaceae archaeon]